VDYDKKFEHKADAGSLKANAVKQSPASPDYWGEIAIDPKNMTAVKDENGLLVYKISGWKKKVMTGASAGSTYLSISVNRWVPDDQKKPVVRQAADDEDDVPFN